jgi:hypothetical protein
MPLELRPVYFSSVVNFFYFLKGRNKKKSPRPASASASAVSVYPSPAHSVQFQSISPRPPQTNKQTKKILPISIPFISARGGREASRVFHFEIKPRRCRRRWRTPRRSPPSLSLPPASPVAGTTPRGRAPAPTHPPTCPPSLGASALQVRGRGPPGAGGRAVRRRRRPRAARHALGGPAPAAIERGGGTRVHRGGCIAGWWG